MNDPTPQLPAATPAPAPGPDAPPPRPRAPQAGHPAPLVFEPIGFLLAMVGILGALALVPIAHAFLASALRLPTPLATGLTVAVAAGFAVAIGATTGWLYRRLAVFEAVGALLLWIAIAVGLVVRSLTAPPPLLAGLAAQGWVILGLSLVGLGLFAATAFFVGSSLAFLLAGSGKLDLSFSYERYVARSHLRLGWRTLVLLFAFVFTLIVPGILVLVVRSYVRARAERRAYVRGELVRRPQTPATLLMTLISVGAVAFGVSAVIVVLSVMSGFSADLKRKILGHTAHGMVLTYGQDDFGDWREVREKTLAVPGVRAATPFLYQEVMLSSGQNLTGAILKGIDVPSVGTVIDLPQSMQSGLLDWLLHPEQIDVTGREATRPETPETPEVADAKPRRALPGILLGRGLAQSLRVLVGDQVNLLSPFGDLGPTGPQPKSRPFRVAGIFYSGMYEYDTKFAYVDLAAAQRFFGAASATGLEVKLREPEAARKVMDDVVVALRGWPYYSKDWSEMNRPLFAALQQEKVAMAVVMGFLIQLATFTIVATLIMMVLEKRREIAVLKSMGAGVPGVMRIFVVEGLVIGGLGAFFGVILGLLFCFLIDKRIPLNPEIYYITSLPVLLDGAQIAIAGLGAVLLSYLATLYPAYKAARLHPVDGLRSE